jgi:DNA-binding NarL/FixJ family response regulator
MNPIRVMCVDDSEVVAESLGRRLRIEKDLVWAGWVQDCATLSATLARSMPDVVLLDVDMPGTDAFRLIVEIKEQAPATRVAMLTSGADGYICKDDDPAAIVAHIRRLADGEFVVSPELGF